MTTTPTYHQIFELFEAGEYKREFIEFIMNFTSKPVGSLEELLLLEEDPQMIHDFIMYLYKGL